MAIYDGSMGKGINQTDDQKHCNNETVDKDLVIVSVISWEKKHGANG